MRLLGGLTGTGFGRLHVKAEVRIKGEYLTMTRATLFLLGACVAAGQAQTPAAFEVASVKPNKVGSNEGPGRGREFTKTAPGSLTMQNIRLTSALVWAYDVQEYQVSGLPWMN